MKLSDRQGFSLATAFLLGNVLTGIGGSGSGPKTGYLSVWLGFGIFAIFCRMFQTVTNENQDNDFFAVTQRLFGKTGNCIFLVFLIAYSFSASFLSIANYMDFIAFSVTTDFPSFVGLVAVLLLTVYLCLKGVKAIGRYAEIILPIVAVSVLLLLILGIKEIRDYTLPLPSSKTQFLRQGWQIFCSPFSEIIFLWILSGRLKNPEKFARISIKAGAVCAALFSLVYLFNVNILGEALLQKMRFPTYFSASLVEIGIIVENAESLITLSYSFCDILYGGVCLLIGVKGVCELLKNFKIISPKTKKITAFSAVIFMFILYICSPLQTNLYEYYPLISNLFLPFTVGLPILLFLLTKRTNQKSNSLSKKL